MRRARSDGLTLSITAKHRRRIIVDDLSYVWWVTDVLEDDFIGTSALSVCSSDKKFLVRYGLAQPDESRYLVVLGRRFQGLPDSPGPWRRFECPRFGTFGMIAPKDVAAFIHWCTDPAGRAVAVDYRGVALPDERCPTSR
jgi:hypothetical protein